MKIFIILIILCLFSTIKNAVAKNLFVAPHGGNDSTEWAENDIDHPWSTVKHAWLNARAGDIVNFRGGTYKVSSKIYTAYDVSDGTAEAPITFKNYKNEPVTISGDCNGDSIFGIEKNYNYVEGINFVGRNFDAGKVIFHIAGNTEATNFKAVNCSFSVLSVNSRSNVAAINLTAVRSRNAIISNCIFNGPGSALGNGIIIFRSQGFIIENNEIRNYNNAIYFKHSNTLEDSGIKIRSNYIHSCNTGIRTISNYALIENNLFIDCGIVMGDDGGTGDGYVGADYNTINHNTFYNASLDMIYQTRKDDPNKGCLYNVIKNNIFMRPCAWHKNRSIAAYTDSDFNLYPPGKIIHEDAISYSLEKWKKYKGHDFNSISGVPVFTPARGASRICDFRLNSTSPGYHAGSDGKDMGADISLLFEGMHRPPRRPANVSIRRIE